MISGTSRKACAACQTRLSPKISGEVIRTIAPLAKEIPPTGYTERVMSTLEPHELEPDRRELDSWQQVEEFLSNLHELARAPVRAEEFYQRLLAGCVATLACQGGAIWQLGQHGNWKLMQASAVGYLSNLGADHERLLNQAVNADHPQVLLPASDGGLEGMVLLMGTVPLERNKSKGPQHPRVIVELALRSGCSPAVQRGWEDFLAAVCQVAADFQSYEELRLLRSEQASHGEVLNLIRRLQSGSSLRQLTSNIANEGRRFLGVDRLSVVLRNRKKWKLQSVSGTERFETRADAVKQLQSLAQVTAHWGEPLDYSDSADADLVADLPTPVSEVLQEYLDNTHVRRLAAVPLSFHSATLLDSQVGNSSEIQAVLIAEDFDSDSDLLLQKRLVELADLCEPSLQQAVRLNRFPVRTMLAWANRWDKLWDSWGVSRMALATAALVFTLAALVFVRVDFEIEAPATLVPLIEQDIFATANGTVREVFVEHGDHVKAGEAICVLEDPQLTLDRERVRGELATARKRLEAIAVARTDRQSREENSSDRLPLSAEARQLELRLESLAEQTAILDRRNDALTLRSPLTGVILTLDVQHLLRTRPVERGQVLFTVADTNSGWQLKTRVPQDQIGHLLAAQNSAEDSLTARFKLAGDAEQVFKGHVNEICETAVMDPEKSVDQLPDIQVDVAVEDKNLPAARPGMEAKVRLLCGKRSLGYVWFHNVWDNVYSWLAF